MSERQWHHLNSGRKKRQNSELQGTEVQPVASKVAGDFNSRPTPAAAASGSTGWAY
jgi:hypothetical protein